MKFGKQLQAHQFPSWSASYLDYKGLKKIINSLAKGRPADAALLAAGILPDQVHQNHFHNHQFPCDPPIELENPEQNLNLHKAAFFFKLERELEKINGFYLQKEADLKVRLRTLIDKRKVVQASRTRRLTKDNSCFTTLYEGFRHFEDHLRKLQGFVEINQIGFRKILKKWDKRSKSSTKELYLSRQVEVQPVFNRECIAELNDVAAANVLELEQLLLDSDDRQPRSHALDANPDRIPSEWQAAIEPQPPHLSAPEAVVEMDVIEFEELETNLIQAVQADNRDQVSELLRVLPVPSSPIDQSAAIRSRLGRILWKAALSADDNQANLSASSVGPTSQSASSRIAILTPSTAMVEHELIPSSRLDFSFVDDISGRSCLHEAASAGRTRLIRLSIEHKVSVSTVDVYGRQPLHYATMNGFPDACRLLLSYGADPYSVDHDGYTPLIYAVTKGQADCVHILLDSAVSLEPARHAGLVPLSLACQYGHRDIALLMLNCGGQILANQEGMWPQHLAAREGHAALLRLLVDRGANVDERDTFSQWTPLFHAASEGHTECVQVLIGANCDCQSLDESRKSPIHYAAWQGHIGCVNLLLAKHTAGRLNGLAKPDGDLIAGPSNPPTRPGHTASGVLPEGVKSGDSLMTGSSPEMIDGDVDLIPDLSLPPPIIPFRIYGHNYLDKKALVQLFLGHPNTARSTRQPVQLYGQPELTSLKLVISNRSDVCSAVHSTILPLDYERESFAFHTDCVEQFTLEFELFPTFGTKIMGKAVGLPTSFEGPWNQRPCVLPLLDKHLKVIGELAFEINVVRPFEGVQLSFGGRVETYWKAMANAAAGAGAVAPQVDSPTGSLFGTPSLHLPSGAFVTASSLSGQYVQVAVQVTRDGVPVIYAGTSLHVQGFEIPVSEVTSVQFLRLAAERALTWEHCMLGPNEGSATRWHGFLAKSMVTLESVLERLPPSLGLDLEIGDPGSGRHGQLELNVFVDAILKTIYEATARTSGTSGREKQSGARPRRRRRLVLSSFEPLVCTALNWKQPNYAVFFASHCGVSGWDADKGQLVDSLSSARGLTIGDMQDRRRRSMLEAAKFAKANNLLGVRLNATLLVRVPSLVQSAKEIGLLVASFGIESGETVGLGVDGHMSAEGVLEYATDEDLELVEGQ